MKFVARVNRALNVSADDFSPDEYISIPQTREEWLALIGNVERLAQQNQPIGVPVIAEIEPHPDPELGHTFAWPPEVDQFIRMQQSGD